MRTRRKAYVCAVIITLFVSLGLQVPGPSQAYVKNIYGYSFTYTTQTQLAWINSIQTSAAWTAATTVLTNSSYLKGLIPVSFYNDPNDKADGWGGTSIKINTARVFTSSSMGGILSHETSHCLFQAWAKAGNWNSFLTYHRSFLTEALAYFTSDCVYKYGPMYSDASIKTLLLNAQTTTKIYAMTWWQTGYKYSDWFNAGTKVTDNQFNQAWWQLHAIGSYLNNGIRSGCSPKVTNLMDNLMILNYNLASPNAAFAEQTFEMAFALAYGKVANARGQYGPWTSPGTLSCDFYFKWQF
jgi:hypothetical protein